MAHSEDRFLTQLIEAQRRLYAYILTLVPQLTDADDVLQETNAVLLRKRDEFTPGTSFPAWACRVAYFEVCAYYKRQHRDRHSFASDEALLESLAAVAQERYDRQDLLLQALSRCLQGLSPQDRQMITLRYRGDASAEAIAERTGRTPGAVRQVLYRIRKSLLACIDRRLASEHST